LATHPARRLIGYVSRIWCPSASRPSIRRRWPVTRREAEAAIYIDVNGLLHLPTMAKTGKEIRVELSLSSIAPEDDRGGPYVLAIVRDVTEQSRAEEFDAHLLRHLSREELISEPNTTLLLDVTSGPTYRSRKRKR
jgi:hypothetical protein